MRIMKIGERCQVRMSFEDDHDFETLFVTPLGGNLYRMEESSLLEPTRYDDVIEAELQSDGSLRFLQVVTPSSLITECYFASDSPSLPPFLDKVVLAGGNWERVFGGILFLHLPPSEHDRLMTEFNNRSEVPDDSGSNVSPGLGPNDKGTDTRQHSHRFEISLQRFRPPASRGGA
jgi:hypothetical protein